jgi:hypothetical protein
MTVDRISLTADKRISRQSMRFRIEPRDVPPEVTARRLGRTLAEFKAALPDLVGLTARIAAGSRRADDDRR